MQNRVLILLISFVASCVMAIASVPTRTVYELNDGWRFFSAAELDSSDADYVSLPHTWQAMLGSYHIGGDMANYTRKIYVPAEWNDRRLFLRFGGVQSVADVFINGSYAGSHKGGFTGFTIEITDKVRYGADNYLRVVVSNAMRGDVLPISSDMDLTAGIYRGVELVIAPRNMISLLHYGSEGVYVVHESVDKNRAIGVVKCYLSTQNSSSLSISMRIVGPDGYQVDERAMRLTKHHDEYAVELPFEIDNPELWSPDSPAMYSVELTLSDGKHTDSVVVNTGFRDISIDDDNRLCINGKPYEVKGVNLAHDREGCGMAVSMEHIAADYAMIRDMGANAIHSLSGPHLSSLYEWCDRDGMLVWVDMPFTHSVAAFTDICYYPTVDFRNNGMEQLTEIIAQNYNHPSVVMWGLFSLVRQQGDNVVEYVKELNDAAHKFDASRLTAGYSNADGEINTITDVVVLRQNVGWQRGSVEDVAVWCRQLASKREWAQYHFGVGYGEEGVETHNVERIERAERGARLLPMRRQTYMHERYSAILDSMGNFWGVWLDNMFDHASARRSHGVNYSGMVEYDHEQTKDAYYLYRAKWNTETPTLYIAEADWKNRRDTLQYIKVYSSVGRPYLLVNGDSVAMSPGSRGVYYADSVVIRGRARIEAIDTTMRYRHSIEIYCGQMQ